MKDICTFILNKKEYLIVTRCDGEIIFFRKGIYVDPWYFRTEETLSMSNLNDTSCAIAVFRKVKYYIIEWVKINEPHYFYFYLPDEKRLRVCQKIIDNTDDPIIKKYTYTRHDDSICFYKLV
jgi:hypothetical protein